MRCENILTGKPGDPAREAKALGRVKSETSPQIMKGRITAHKSPQNFNLVGKWKMVEGNLGYGSSQSAKCVLIVGSKMGDSCV